jgi:hypothetical protein
MYGDFGVFDHVELKAEFGDDVSAEEYLTQLKAVGAYVPTYADSLFVAEIPEDYWEYWRLLQGLIRSRDEDRALEHLRTEMEDMRSDPARM